MPNPLSFRYFKTSPEIIQLAVMLYVISLLSLKNVEDQTAFKRALEATKGVYQKRTAKGNTWFGIQPCLMVWCSLCSLCRWFGKLLYWIFYGDFFVWPTQPTLPTFFLLFTRGGNNISINPLVDTQRAASLQETETVKLTVLTLKSQFSAVYGNPRGWQGTRPGRP